MPLTSTYQKNISYTLSNATNYFSRTITATNTASGSARTVISETVPASANGSGLAFNFFTGSGSFAAFSSTGPLLISGFGAASNTINLSGQNNYTSIFARTGSPVQWESSDSLSIPSSAITNVYVFNYDTGNTQTLTIEALTDASAGWGS